MRTVNEILTAIAETEQDCEHCAFDCGDEDCIFGEIAEYLGDMETED